MSEPRTDRPADLPAGTVATLAAEHLPPSLMRSVTAEFTRRGQVHRSESSSFPTPAGPVDAVRWAVSVEDYDDPEGTGWLASLLQDAAHQLSGDVTTTVLPAGQRPRKTGMLIMDVDSTLIDQEVIDLLAAHAGREAEVAEITERAMRGELDFAGSLHARVAALEGLPVTVLEEVLHQVTPSPGAQALIAAVSSRGWPVVAVSGGVRPDPGPAG
ncbi:HAD-IB family phosphatase [Nesterenkonia alba]|uniref:HAD-IB family phosphatase n=1 Tax=Nesterenkonia alba TaxID=515814 RepID=UPI00040256B9|nr:HAD-IB family phosphatase [Nesterenkonia alba]